MCSRPATPAAQRNEQRHERDPGERGVSVAGKAEREQNAGDDCEGVSQDAIVAQLVPSGGYGRTPRAGRSEYCSQAGAKNRQVG